MDKLSFLSSKKVYQQMSNSLKTSFLQLYCVDFYYIESFECKTNTSPFIIVPSISKDLVQIL